MYKHKKRNEGKVKNKIDIYIYSYTIDNVYYYFGWFIT